MTIVVLGAVMARLRTFLLAYRWVALALVLAALAVRIAVPAGMMPGAGATLIVCPGHMAAMSGMAPAAHGDARRPATRHDAPAHDVPCAFTGLFAATIGTAPGPVLLPRPFIVAAALAAVLVTMALPRRRLWPPRRGPPVAFA